MSESAPLVRVEPEDPSVLAYLHAHHREAFFSLHDLLRGQTLPPVERPDVLAYARSGAVIAVQCLYADGRWLPHLADDDALPALLDDALRRPLRWAVGCRRVMDPVMGALARRSRTPTYDQREVLCAVDAAHLAPQTAHGGTVRKATPADVPLVAELRQAFEEEYFAIRTAGGLSAWYLAVAECSVRDGTWLAEVDGRPVATASVEADIPELTHIAAVYTRPACRGRGLARAVVSAICQEALRAKPRATLTVRADNVPAWRAYRSIGFAPWDEYRVCRL